MNRQKVLGVSEVDVTSAGRREAERSEVDRSSADVESGAAPQHSDPEVVAQAKRRRFTAEYKLRILQEVDEAKGSGGIGALLRREGLYSSVLATWRREREAGVRQALAPQKRGPKSKYDPVVEENQRFHRANQRPVEEL